MLTNKLTFLLNNNILNVQDVIFMFDKLVFKLRNKFMYLDTKILIYKVLDQNIIVSNIAKEELVHRDLDNIDIPDTILEQVISKLSIEQIWFLVSTKQQNHFMELVYLRLNKILDYYQKMNKNEFDLKRYEEEAKIFSLK